MKWIFLRLVRLAVFAFWPSFPLSPLRERPPLPRVRAVNRINLVCWPQNWDLLNSQLKPTPASTKATAEGGVRDTHTNARELNMHAHSHTHARQYMFLKACEKVKLRTVSHSLRELLHPHRTHTHSLTHTRTPNFNSNYATMTPPDPSPWPTASWACFTWTLANTVLAGTVEGSIRNCVHFSACHSIAQGVRVIRTVDIGWEIIL